MLIAPRANTVIHLLTQRSLAVRGSLKRQLLRPFSSTTPAASLARLDLQLVKLLTAHRTCRTPVMQRSYAG
jgi:hypothetical protein